MSTKKEWPRKTVECPELTEVEKYSLCGYADAISGKGGNSPRAHKFYDKAWVVTGGKHEGV